MKKTNGVLTEVTEKDMKLLAKNPKKFWKGVTEIGSHAFDRVYFPKGEVEIPEGVVRIQERAFEESDIADINKQLKKVKFPSTLKVIDFQAFYGCTGLEVADFSEASSLESLGSDCFFSCKNLQSLGEHPLEELNGQKSASFSKSLTKIGAHAFGGCSQLRSVTFEEGSNLQEIGFCAFRASGLTTFKVPEGVTLIEDNAFYGCSYLSDFEYKPSRKPSFGGNTIFGNCNNLTADGIHTTSELEAKLVSMLPTENQQKKQEVKQEEATQLTDVTVAQEEKQEEKQEDAVQITDGQTKQEEGKQEETSVQKDETAEKKEEKQDETVAVTPKKRGRPRKKVEEKEEKQEEQKQGVVDASTTKQPKAEDKKATEVKNQQPAENKQESAAKKQPAAKKEEPQVKKEETGVQNNQPEVKNDQPEVKKEDKKPENKFSKDVSDMFVQLAKGTIDEDGLKGILHNKLDEIAPTATVDDLKLFRKTVLEAEEKFIKNLNEIQKQQEEERQKQEEVNGTLGEYDKFTKQLQSMKQGKDASKAEEGRKL